MILYIENPQEFSKNKQTNNQKLLELVNNSIRLKDTRSTQQKSTVFLCTGNEQSENKKQLHLQ